MHFTRHLAPYRNANRVFSSWMLIGSVVLLARRMARGHRSMVTVAYAYMAGPDQQSVLIINLTMVNLSARAISVYTYPALVIAYRDTYTDVLNIVPALGTRSVPFCLNPGMGATFSFAGTKIQESLQGHRKNRPVRLRGLIVGADGHKYLSRSTISALPNNIGESA